MIKRIINVIHSGTGPSGAMDAHPAVEAAALSGPEGMPLIQACPRQPLFPPLARGFRSAGNGQSPTAEKCRQLCLFSGGIRHRSPVFAAGYRLCLRLCSLMISPV